MADALVVDNGITIDILDQPGVPALSSISDVPMVETKPDAQNEGAPPAAPAEPEKAEAEEQPGESATPATEEAPAEPAKKESRGVQKALDRLTAEREAEKRRAADAEERLDRALKALEQATTARAEPEPEPVAPQRPNREAFPDPDAYDTALIEFAKSEARKEVEIARAEDLRAAEARRIEAQLQERQTQYMERLAKAKTKYADFDEVATRADVKLPMPVAYALVGDERGPELQYYFGANPEEAKRLMSLPRDSQLVELGIIRATKLDKPEPPAPVVISSAPKPIKPISPGTESNNFDPETASMDAYASKVREREGWADPQRPKANPRARH